MGHVVHNFDFLCMRENNFAISFKLQVKKLRGFKPRNSFQNWIKIELPVKRHVSIKNVSISGELRASSRRDPTSPQRRADRTQQTLPPFQGRP